MRLPGALADLESHPGAVPVAAQSRMLSIARPATVRCANSHCTRGAPVRETPAFSAVMVVILLRRTANHARASNWTRKPQRATMKPLIRVSSSRPAVFSRRQ